MQKKISLKITSTWALSCEHDMKPCIFFFWSEIACYKQYKSLQWDIIIQKKTLKIISRWALSCEHDMKPCIFFWSEIACYKQYKSLQWNI